MKAIKKAPAKAKGSITVKQRKDNKITVSVKLRFYKGCRVAAMDNLPDHVKRLIILKIAAFELQLETLLNDAVEGARVT
jgi:hypothetical protein